MNEKLENMWDALRALGLAEAARDFGAPEWVVWIEEEGSPEEMERGRRYPPVMVFDEADDIPSGWLMDVLPDTRGTVMLDEEWDS